MWICDVFANTSIPARRACFKPFREISPNHALVLGLVADLLRQGEVLPVLICFANCGGAKDYFVARTQEEFDQRLARLRERDQVTVFLPPAFPVRGPASPGLCKEALALLDRCGKEEAASDDPGDPGLDVVRLDNDAWLHFYPRHPEWQPPHKEVREWFQENPGVPVAVGRMVWGYPNTESEVNVYVRDPDGSVRTAAY